MAHQAADDLLVACQPGSQPGRVLKVGLSPGAAELLQGHGAQDGGDLPEALRRRGRQPMHPGAFQARQMGGGNQAKEIQGFAAGFLLKGRRWSLRKFAGEDAFFTSRLHD